MSLAETLLLALSLSLDASAVALAATAAGRISGHRSALRLCFHFGIFQFLMPVVGWAAGTEVQPYIAPVDHWVAFGLLTFVGVRMMRSVETNESSIENLTDPSRGWVLVTLSTATSIDALAVGLGLAALRVSIWYPSAIIGVVTMAMSTLAVFGGRRAGAWLGARAQFVGGLVLVLIGVRIVFVHMSWRVLPVLPSLPVFH
jgi:manganese efflux pump family protein